MKREVFDETNNDWNAYKEQVEQYFITNGIKEEKQVAVLLSIIGKQNVWAILQSLSAPARPSDLSFKTIVETPQKHLSPKPLLIAERFLFCKKNQLEGDQIHKYLPCWIKEVDTVSWLWSEL